MDEYQNLCEEQSAPSADYSAASAAEMRVSVRRKTFFMKVGENAEQLAVSKVRLIRNDTLLTFLGEIIHGDLNVGECYSSLQGAIIHSLSK